MNEDVKVEILFFDDGVVQSDRPQFQVYGNRRSLRAQLAHDSAIAVLSKCADDLGRIAELGWLKRGAEDHLDFALRHRHIEWAQVEEWMAEREHPLAVVIRDCTHAGG